MVHDSFKELPDEWKTMQSLYHIHEQWKACPSDQKNFYSALYRREAMMFMGYSAERIFQPVTQSILVSEGSPPS